MKCKKRIVILVLILIILLLASCQNAGGDIKVLENMLETVKTFS
jgi:predicted small secreted protein